MSKRLFLESSQGWIKWGETIQTKSEKRKFIQRHFLFPRHLFLYHTHTQNPPSSSPHVPITPSPLYTLTFTTWVPAQDLSFFSYSIFPHTVPTVLSAPAGGSSFFWSFRLQELDVNTVTSAPLLHSLKPSLTHTDCPLLGKLRWARHMLNVWNGNKESFLFAFDWLWESWQPPSHSYV